MLVSIKYKSAGAPVTPDGMGVQDPWNVDAAAKGVLVKRMGIGGS